MRHPPDMVFSIKRPLEEEALALVLRELAEVTAIASSLSSDLEPLSAEDIELGAEPLSKEQIQEELEAISQKITHIVLFHLKADSSEWYAAVDTVK